MEARSSRVKWMVCLLVVVVAIATVVVVSKQRARKPGPWNVKIATGTTGGTFNVLGTQLARILEELPEKPIEVARAKPSSGSRENIERLLNSEADLAFVVRPALAVASDEERGQLRVLARLYRDVVQVVVREDAGIKRFGDLSGKRIFIGPNASGTHIAATSVLERLGVEKHQLVAAESYKEAVGKLEKNEIDAAIFLGGIPTTAVRDALASDRAPLRLLDLVDDIEKLTSAENQLGFETERIPAGLYDGQSEPVTTIGTDVYLMSRDTLHEELAYRVVAGLFDNPIDLMMAHTRAGDIRLTRAFEVPEGVALHAGAMLFRERDQQTLLIATGALNGRYYNLGCMIKSLLDQRNIRSRVVHTDGSFENARLLAQRPTLAFMQYDAALASRFGTPRSIYSMDFPEAQAVLNVGSMRRIAVLHLEKAHVIARRELLEGREAQREITLADLRDTIIARVNDGKRPVRVCFGPQSSGTRLLAEATFRRHGIPFAEGLEIRHLAVTEMVEQLHDEKIDVGCFVSGTPSEAVKTILADEGVRLLSLEPKVRARMLGPAYVTATFEPGVYTCQLKGEVAVQTIATRAVLVTTESLPGFDVGKIAQAVMEGEAFLGVQGGAKAMAQALPSLPLHSAAVAYYEKMKYLPSKPPIDWLNVIYSLLAIMVILVAGYKGGLELKRMLTGDEIGRRIIAISLEAEEPRSVEMLQGIQTELEDRVRRPWWRRGSLNWRRWRYLHDLTEERIVKARENLTRALVAEIRAVREEKDLEYEVLRERFKAIHDRIWRWFESHELEASQRRMLHDVLQDSIQHADRG